MIGVYLKICELIEVDCAKFYSKQFLVINKVNDVMVIDSYGNGK